MYVNWMDLNSHIAVLNSEKCRLCCGVCADRTFTPNVLQAWRATAITSAHSAAEPSVLAVPPVRPAPRPSARTLGNPA